MSDQVVAGIEHHTLTFRMSTDTAVCLRCRRLLTLDDLGSRCQGAPPERAQQLKSVKELEEES